MNAQLAGAIAVVIFNNEAGGPVKMAAVDAQQADVATGITVPVVSISKADGIQLAAAIKAGPTTISLQGTCSLSQVAACYLQH